MSSPEDVPIRILVVDDHPTVRRILCRLLKDQADFTLVGIDKQEVLDQALEAAKTFSPMNREEMAQLLAKTKEVAMAGKYELFKTSSHFDSTAKHPDWLGGDTADVQDLAPPSA